MLSVWHYELIDSFKLVTVSFFSTVVVTIHIHIYIQVALGWRSDRQIGGDVPQNGGYWKLTNGFESATAEIILYKMSYAYMTI